MNSKYTFVIFLSIIITISTVALAIPNTDRVPATNEKSGKEVLIPAHAVQIADGVFSLGVSIDIDGKQVEGYMFIDKREKNAKPGTVCGNDICEASENAKKCPQDCSSDSGDDGTGDPTCYSHLGKNVKWNNDEPWEVNPSNSEGLSDSDVFNTLTNNIQKWEDAAGVNILGSGSTTAKVLVADTVSPDGVNEIYFDDVSNQGAIAVTIAWGIFRGPPSGRELVEFDQIYDQEDYNWSLSGEIDKMDFDGISNHEIGHGIGMGHPPDVCVNETMYAFASLGETKKRDLNSGDIAGIQALY